MKVIMTVITIHFFFWFIAGEAKRTQFENFAWSSATYPPPNAINVSVTPFFDWGDVPNAKCYHLQVSSTSSFTSTYLDIDNIKNSEYQVDELSSLQYLTVYYWRVKPNNFEYFSMIYNFQTEY